MRKNFPPELQPVTPAPHIPTICYRDIPLIIIMRPTASLTGCYGYKFGKLA